ncbi:MAG: hypothetical protein A2Y14_02505 [Verrucomicrobia bacterium GWF2_51_19]|nr:MAG: hypothetical protein A2Y14_02505 [Verrucomicrobia bacterium GWF2_51_19]HCJ11986.1 hypothetical protein [Opitutae bacterium]
MKKTDWDIHYLSPSKFTIYSRWVTKRLLIRTLKKWLPTQGTIAELGGAGSCTYQGIRENCQCSRYVMVDINDVGLEMVKKRLLSPHDACWKQDLTVPIENPPEVFDLVFSVGLIEHFDIALTKRVIDNHFALTKKGGIVLMTYPTPTLPYKITRFILEKTSNWIFFDERPLKAPEVVADIQSAGGEVLSHFINYGIPLTQGYVIARKA